jgi:hypothetical protein
VYEDCLERLGAIQQLRPRGPLSAAVHSGRLLFVWSFLALEVRLLENEWAIGLNGMKRDALEGMTSSTRRTSASNRTMKISASIATFFESTRPNSDANSVRLFLQKTVIGSTPFAR